MKNGRPCTWSQWRWVTRAEPAKGRRRARVSPQNRRPVPRSSTIGSWPGRLERDARGVAAVAPVGVARARRRAPDAEEGDVQQWSPPVSPWCARHVTGAAPADARSCDGSLSAPPRARSGTTASTGAYQVAAHDRSPRGGSTANDVEFAYLEAGRRVRSRSACTASPTRRWTWRHLLPALADAGFRAVAPFMRGYAPTAVPADGRYQTGALGARRLRAARGARRRRRRRDHRPRLGRDGHLRRRRTTSRSGGGGSSPWPCRRPARWPAAFLQLRPAQEELVHVLLPARRWPTWSSAMDDLAFIDGLWADWSPGYDGAEDLAHVKDALRDPANLAAALGYYRATLGGVGVDPALDAVQAAGGDADRPADAVPPRPHRRLHGRRGGRGRRPPSSRPRAPGSRSSTAPATSSTSRSRPRSTG